MVVERVTGYELDRHPSTNVVGQNLFIQNPQPSLHKTGKETPCVDRVRHEIQQWIQSPRRLPKMFSYTESSHPLFVSFQCEKDEYRGESYNGI